MVLLPSPMMEKVVINGGTAPGNMEYYTERNHMGKGKGKNPTANNVSYSLTPMTPKFAKMPRHPNLINLEKELSKWYIEMSQKRPITNNDIANRARQLGKKFQVHKGFLYSRGWVCRFKKRYNFTKSYKFSSSNDKSSSTATQLRPHQQKQFARMQELEFDADTVEEMEPEDFVGNFNPEDTYSMYLCTLYFKALPDAAKGPPKANDILRVILVTNKDGSDKQTPIVIGSENLTRDNHDHISYFATEDGHLNQAIFDLWLGQFDSKMRKERKNSILLINDSFAEMVCVPDGMTNVEVVFSSSLSLEEYKNLGQVFRANYRQLQICHLNECLQGRKSPSLTVDEALIFIKLAWDETFFPIPESIREEMQEIDVELAYLMQDIRRPLGIQKLLSPQEYFSLEDNVDNEPANSMTMALNGTDDLQNQADPPSSFQTLNDQKKVIFKPDTAYNSIQKNPVKKGIESDDDVEIIEESSQNESTDQIQEEYSSSQLHNYEYKWSEPGQTTAPPTQSNQEWFTSFKTARLKGEDVALKASISLKSGQTDGELDRNLDMEDFHSAVVGALHPSNVPSDNEARNALQTIRNFLERHRSLDDINYKRLKSLTQSVEAIIVGHNKQRTITDYFTKA